MEVNVICSPARWYYNRPTFLGRPAARLAQFFTDEVDGVRAATEKAPPPSAEIEYRKDTIHLAWFTTNTGENKQDAITCWWCQCFPA